MTDIPIFVITDKSGRELTLTNFLKSQGLEFTCVQAVYFEKLPETYNPKRSLLFSRRKLSLRELGCAQAHQNTYKSIISKDIPLALILEEDAIVLDGRMLIQSIEIVQKTFRKSGFIASYYSENAEISRIGTKIRPWRRCFGFPSGAVAYLIDKKAAKDLVSYNSNLDFAADWPPATEISFYLNTNRIISHSNLISKIEKSRRLNELSYLVKVGNLVDLILCTRFIKLRQITNIRFQDYLRLLYLPVIFRYFRKLIRLSKTHRSK